MQIHQLFSKDISRRVNPAVVANIAENETTQQEIEEYIFTPEITGNVYKFLAALLLEHQGKTGVWINGYYGSGKSHFIKYLYYCLSINQYPNAFERLVASLNGVDPLSGPTLMDMNTIRTKLTSTDIDMLLFNIDSASSQGGQGTSQDKTRITRILFNKLNALRGYNDSNIALALYLERVLDKKGVFGSFKSKLLSEFGEEWDGNQNTYIQSFLEAVLTTARTLIPELDTESLRLSITNDADTSIELFIRECQDFLVGKKDNYRLIFLIDEMSQYIGNNTNLLLNLQTIVEEVGEKCSNKIWIACTAQQALRDLVSDSGAGADSFGKILGRFETKISLQSTDAAHITKKRILDKNANAIGVLDTYFKGNKQAIENQFHFDNHVYQNFASKEDFILTYPFIPYQFKLISDVFASFSQAGYVSQGVKNTERAILGITHATAKENKDQEVGYFISFDRFFNAQLRENLTHNANQIIFRAFDLNEVKDNVFYKRVVQALFMVSSLSDNYAVSFPATTENLAILLMDNLNTSKSDIIREVQPVLDYLEKNFIIQLQNGKYRFLSDEEIAVAEEIKNHSVTLDERLNYMWEDFIKQVLSPSFNFSYNNKNIKPQYKVDDKEITGKNDFIIQFCINTMESADDIAMRANTYDLYIPLSLEINKDQSLKNAIFEYIKTQSYIATSRSNASERRQKALQSFREYNVIRGGEIKEKIRWAMSSIPVLSGSEIKQANQFTAADVKKRLEDMVEWHLSGVYKKNQLSVGYAITAVELQTKAASAFQGSTTLTPAETEVESMLNLGITNLDELVKKFEKIPYGWKDISTIDVVMQLIRKRVRTASHNNQPVTVQDFAVRAVSSTQRSLFKIEKEQHMDCAPGIANINKAFGKILVNTHTIDKYEMLSAFKAGVKDILTSVNKVKNDYPNELFSSVFSDYHKVVADLYESTTPEILSEKIESFTTGLAAMRDNYEYALEFAHTHYLKYKELGSFIRSNATNLKSMDAIDKDLLSKAEEYFSRDKHPWDQYAQMRQACKEFDTALTSEMETVKSKTVILYKEAVDRIGQVAAENGIDVADLPDIKQVESNIKGIPDIATIKLKANEVSKFESDQLKKLTPKEKVTEIDLAAISGTKILNTEADIDKYISNLRTKLIKALADADKIIIR
jgi:hypothetical protein